MDRKQSAGGQMKMLRDSGDRTSGLRETPQITMYTTRFCPYCMRARQLFQRRGWAYEEISVDGNPGLRSEMIEKSGRHTVPQIWIGDQHVGGYDDLFKLRFPE